MNEREVLRLINRAFSAHIAGTITAYAVGFGYIYYREHK
jgi:hypothetical protein